METVSFYKMIIQWNSSCKATSIAPEKWSLKRGGLSSGFEINTFILRFTLLIGLSRGVASHQGGLSKGVPLYLIDSAKYKRERPWKVWIDFKISDKQ